MAPIVALSTISVAPAFFVGALGVEVRTDLGFGTAALGLAVSIYFLATALTTRPLGRFADRVGGRRAGVIAVLLIAACLLGIAASPSWWILVAVLTVGGMGNALAGPTTSLLLARQIPLGSLGLGFGVKQSSVPLATLAAGLAVPVVATHVPWQWMFVLVGGLTLTVIAIVPHTQPAPPAPEHGKPKTSVPGPAMVSLAVAFGLVIAAVTSLGSLFVDSAVASDLSAGSAGVILAIGSLVAVVVRLALGAWSDTTRRDLLRTVGTMMALGAIGFPLIAAGSLVPMAVGVVVVFGMGWGWSGLFMFAVTRHNMAAPATATGVVQTGAATGGVLGPVSIGYIAEHLGYAPAWWLTGCLMVLAAIAAFIGSAGLAAHVDRSEGNGATS